MKYCYPIKLFVLAFFKIINPSRMLLLMLMLLLLSLKMQAQTYWGSGSRDLYKPTSLGNRALLMSRGTSSSGFDPFSNDGRMMVYAKPGEKINVASSVQGRSRSGTNATIRLYSPNGTLYTSGTTAIASANSGTGKILNRTQELAGPTTSFHAGGYTPYSVTVGPTEEGIWIIEFVSTGVGSQQTDINILANADWNTANQETISTTGVDGSGFIIAWDASVSDNTEFKSGRLFTTVFNGSISGLGDGFYGKFYVLTKDGFTYAIDNNGQNGLSFNFFVNNKGVYDASQVPLYKSATGSTDANTKIWDPRKLDAGTNITHKMFYVTPDLNLPDTTFIWDAVGSSKVQTWLKNERGDPNLDSTKIKFFGFEGEEGISGPKGGYVRFESTVNGKYEITIPFGGSRPDKVLKGNCVMGINNVLWDGTDGNNVRVNTTTTIAGISARLEGAEVHFPLIDVENNPNAVIIELLDNNYQSLSPKMDKVYWDNTSSSGTDLTPLGTLPPSPMTNLTGRASTTLGHKWGENNVNGANNFGNDKVVDTWSFAPGEEAFYEGLSITVLETDLRVDGVTKTAGPNTVSVGDQLTYEVPISNVGPSGTKAGKPATFFFYVPKGVTVDYNAVTFNSTSGTITHHGLTNPPIAVNTASAEVNVYKVTVDMPSGSGGKFTIPVTVTGAVPTRYINAWGVIMRSDDITDPNASYTNNLVQKPVDPFQEANGIHKLISDLNLNTDITTNTDFVNLRGSIAGTTLPSSVNYTNNIKYNNEVQMYADVKVSKSVSPVGPHTVGQQVTFTITAENLGESVANDIVVDDLLSSRFIYVSHSAPAGTTYNPATGIWNIGALTKAQVLAPLQIVATINATGGAQINTATITANEFDVDLSNNTASAATTVPSSLSITKTGVRTGTGNASGTASFVVTVKNTGAIEASGIQVIDQLPARYNQNPPLYSVSVGTATNGGTGNRTITWELGSLAPGAEAYLLITSNFSNASSTLTNTAEITGGPNASATPANNSGTARDLQITKSVNPTTQNVGQNVIFTITTSRASGSGSASDVVIRDVLPPGYTQVSNTTPTAGTYNSGTNEWSITSLNNTVRTLTITAKVNAPTGAVNEYRNVAVITAGDHVDSAPGNNWAEATVTPILADLKIVKTVNNESPVIGANVVFTLTASNLGPNNATGVKVTDVLPAGYTYVSNTAPSIGSFVSGTGVWTIGNFNNAANATLTITAKVNAVGPYLNTATITGDQYDTVSTNNSSAISVTPGAALFITNPMIYQRFKN
ncbi:MAG: DUF11 domain-containing protein [Bacteroidota bacterium]